MVYWCNVLITSKSKGKIEFVFFFAKNRKKTANTIFLLLGRYLPPLGLLFSFFNVSISPKRFEHLSVLFYGSFSAINLVWCFWQYSFRLNGSVMIGNRLYAFLRHFRGKAITLF